MHKKQICIVNCNVVDTCWGWSRHTVPVFILIVLLKPLQSMAVLLPWVIQPNDMIFISEFDWKCGKIYWLDKAVIERTNEKYLLKISVKVNFVLIILCFHFKIIRCNLNYCYDYCSSRFFKRIFCLSDVICFLLI